MDTLADDSVDHPVRLEKGLPIIPDAQRDKFLRMGAPLRKCGQAFHHPLNAIEHVARLRRTVVLRNIVADVLKITCRVLGQEYLKALQSTLFFLARKRPITSVAGTTLPSSICRLPKARILSSASVS